MSDPLTDRWIASWVAMRGLRLTHVDGWPLVHVRSRSRGTEVVCVDPDVEQFRALLPHIASNDVAMLTVVGRDLNAYRAMALPDDVRVDRDDETLMTATITQKAVTSLPADLVGRWDIDGQVIHYSIEDRDRVVSEGAMGLNNGWATFDSVETSRTHQRRGLGRHVMSTLLAHAHQHDARNAILAASSDGRGLYTSLGWTVERELWSLMGTCGTAGT